MITIGTDCSGIDAPIEALKQLGIPYQHKWSCEIDKFARQSIMANHPPEIMYEDITTRHHSQLPDVDIYVCGFPCQSFSTIGKKRGTADPRGNIMLHCINVIKTKQPPVFILENVKNFRSIQNSDPFSRLLSELSAIKNSDGAPLYSLCADIYNTKDYGIPQNRERLYIIGIHTEILLQPYQKPQPIPLQPLEQIIDSIFNTTFKPWPTILKNLKKIGPNTQIVTPFAFYSAPEFICPALTTCCSKYFVVKQNRMLSIDECLKLQGFDATSFQKAVSDTQLYKQIGNSMSVNVLKAILTQIFDSTIMINII
jgi:DNA (cytosine-5)-methyltransferase 1